MTELNEAIKCMAVTSELAKRNNNLDKAIRLGDDYAIEHHTRLKKVTEIARDSCVTK